MKRMTWLGFASLTLIGSIAVGCVTSSPSGSAGSTAQTAPAGDPTTAATTVVGTGGGTVESTPGTDARYSNGWGDDWFQFGLSRGPGGNLGPNALAVRDDGETYVLDTVKKRVMVFRPDGSILRTFHADTERATRIAVTSDGYVALGDPGTDHSARVYGPGGDLVADVTLPGDLVADDIRAHGTQVWVAGRFERSGADGLPAEYTLIWDGGGVAARRTRSPRLPSGANGSAADVGYDASGRLVYELEARGVVTSGVLPGGEGHGVVDWGVDDRGDLVIAAERTGSASPGWDAWKVVPQGGALGPQRVDSSRWAEATKPVAVAADGCLHLFSSRDDGATLMRVRMAWNDSPGPIRPLTYGAGNNDSPVVDGDWSAWVTREGDLFQVYACRLPWGDPFPAGPPSVDIQSLRLDGGRLVWQAKDSQGRQIYLFDPAAGVTRKLTEGTADPWAPQLHGDLVLWSETPRGGGGTRLVLLDLGTGERTGLSENMFGEGRTGGDHVVWSEAPTSSPDTARVFLYDRLTGETTQITAGDFDAYDAHVADGLAAWRAFPPDAPQGEIYAFSISSRQTTRVTRDRFEKTEVNTGGGLVVWIAREDDHDVIYAWTEADGLTSTIADDSSSKQSLQLIGDWVAWEQCSDSDRSGIYLHHLPSGVTIRASPPPRDRYTPAYTRPRLAAGSLVFVSNDAGGNVLLYTFAADRAPDSER